MSDLMDRIDLRHDFIATKMAQHVISDTGCWEYTGYLKENGYGTMKIYVRDFYPKKRTFLIHRVSYAYFNGEDPGELFVCHKCDNPSCINPDHLFLGTPLDNTRDMWNKGRAADQGGMNNGRCKLSEDVVEQIVESIKNGKSNTAIAAELPVTHSQVSLIRGGKSWRWLTEKLGYKPEDYYRSRAA